MITKSLPFEPRYIWATQDGFHTYGVKWNAGKDFYCFDTQITEYSHYDNLPTLSNKCLNDFNHIEVQEQSVIWMGCVDRYAVFDLKTRKFTWKFQRHPQIIALADTFNDINVNFQPQSLIRFEITQDLKVFSFDENLWINNRHVKLPFYSCSFPY
jgi:hypothetical protein